MKTKDRIPSPDTRITVDRHGVVISIVRPPIINYNPAPVKKAKS